MYSTLQVDGEAPFVSGRPRKDPKLTPPKVQGRKDCQTTGNSGRWGVGRKQICLRSAPVEMWPPASPSILEGASWALVPIGLSLLPKYNCSYHDLSWCLGSGGVWYLQRDRSGKLCTLLWGILISLKTKGKDFSFLFLVRKSGGQGSIPSMLTTEAEGLFFF